MRTRWATLALLAMTAAPIAAQDARVAGRVTLRGTGAGIPGVTISIPELKSSTLSDSAGYFDGALTPGSHLVVAQRIGFEPDSVRLFFKSGETYEWNFQLAGTLVKLDTVTTKAAATKYISPALKGFEERRVKGFGHFIEEAELRKADNSSLGTVLQRMPGIKVIPYKTSDFASSSRGGGGGGGGGFAIIGGGGSGNRAIPSDRASPRGCWVAVYLDGLRIYAGAGSGDNAPDLARTLVRELAGIEYYAGGASLPAEFSAIKASDCGVLLLWTRER
jgi:hypothetical protein